MDNTKKFVASSMISAVQYGVLQKIRERGYEASIVHVENLSILIRVKERSIAGVQDPGPRYFRIKVSEQL